MVQIIVKGERKGHYQINKHLHAELCYVRRKVLNQTDMAVILVDGRPGSGKSTLAVQLGFFLSRGRLPLRNIVFDDQQFSDALDQAQPGDSIIVDEAFDLLNKRSTLSAQNRMVLSMMQKARFRRVFIFVVLPSVYDLDKNIVLNLADCFIHCYRQPFGHRGQYHVYTMDDLRKLWFYGRQTHSYSFKVAKPNFGGAFAKFFPIDYDAYEQKKFDSLKGRVNEIANVTKQSTQRNNLINAMHKDGKSAQEIADLVGISPRSVYRVLDKFKFSGAGVG